MRHKRKPHRERKRYDSCYGAFPGGDPRQFFPDGDSLPEEMDAYKLACAAWDAGDMKRIPSAHMEAMTTEGAVVLHVTEQRFGLGVYQFRVPMESRKERLTYWREAKQRMIADECFTAEEIRDARREYFR